MTQLDYINWPARHVVTNYNIVTKIYTEIAAVTFQDRQLKSYFLHHRYYYTYSSCSVLFFTFFYLF